LASIIKIQAAAEHGKHQELASDGAGKDRRVEAEGSQPWPEGAGEGQAAH